MSIQQGRGMVRLADGSSHGGTVVSASARYRVRGVAVARAGDLVRCPQCGGDYAILPTPGAMTDRGQTLALHGSETACGARLIASLQPGADASS